MQDFYTVKAPNTFTHSVVVPSRELCGKGRCGVFAGKTVWSTPERLRGEVLTMRCYTNLHLPLPLLSVRRLNEIYYCSMSHSWQLLKVMCWKWFTEAVNTLPIFSSASQTFTASDSSMSNMLWHSRMSRTLWKIICTDRLLMRRDLGSSNVLS